MQTNQLQSLPATVLDTPVEGVNLRPGTLREQLGDTPTLLIFLRHFGCLFCREMVQDIRQFAATTPDYPPVLFFYQGNGDEGKHFFDRYWPEARAVADSPKTFYTAFGIERGGLKEMLGPEVWACGIRAASKGHTGGIPVGDPWMMPGAFLVQGDQIIWRHTFRHAGDHPDFAKIAGVAMSHQPAGMS